jgi:redox-sensitive bicupin YhaK (pirin superfamily)
MPIQHVLEPLFKDLGGGFVVRRLLPSGARQAVGPFVFFDHFGPVTSRPGDNHDVRPHPHIGLSTVTYLFEGAMMHRDSTGVVQRIEPGAINWMTAGKGIVHSERTPDDLRAVTSVSHGLQLWCALPDALEECDPAFVHTPAADIPEVAGQGFTARVLIGAMFGVESPVRPLSPTLYVEVTMAPGSLLHLPESDFDRAVYGLDRAIDIDGDAVAPFTLAVLSGEPAVIAAPSGVHLVIIGGEPLGHRHMVWNFVSSRKERIADATAAWRAQTMGQVPGETEFIPF